MVTGILTRIRIQHFNKSILKEGLSSCISIPENLMNDGTYIIQNYYVKDKSTPALFMTMPVSLRYLRTELIMVGMVNGLVLYARLL